jgi:hypothetical protein
MNFSRNISALIVVALIALCCGCGWATPASKKNTMTGVSESGYPKGQSPDPESPALASMEKQGHEKKPAEKK